MSIYPKESENEKGEPGKEQHENTSKPIVCLASRTSYTTSGLLVGFSSVRTYAHKRSFEYNSFTTAGLTHVSHKH